VTMLPIFLTFLLAAAVCLVLLSLSRFVGPRRPTPVKVQPFECGMEQIDKPRSQLSIKFSVIAMLFIIFDIEVAFLYPWAVQFRQLGITGLLAVIAFLLILTVGFVYAWRRGALEWN
jgi:NADH:ubiquinone oxidoreductase subunit 3 (subunit A)